MSTQREIVDKFKEAYEAGDLTILDPYLADDMTYQVLPSTFVLFLARYSLEI